MGFIGEMRLCTFLSVAKEKYQQNRHARKGPRSFPCGSYPLSGAAFLPFGKKALCAGTSRVAGCPQPRRSAELAGQTCSRGCARNFLFLLRVLGDFRADGAPPFVRGIGCPRPSAQSDSFAPRGRRGRAARVGFLREASMPPLSGALLVLFSRQGEKSTQIKLPHKLQRIMLSLPSAYTPPR